MLDQLISGIDHLCNFSESDQRGSKKSSKQKSFVKNKKKNDNVNGGERTSTSTNISKIRGSALYQIPVPNKHLETKTYGACAEYLACRVRY